MITAESGLYGVLGGLPAWRSGCLTPGWRSRVLNIGAPLAAYGQLLAVFLGLVVITRSLGCCRAPSAQVSPVVGTGAPLMSRGWAPVPAAGGPPACDGVAQSWVDTAGLFGPLGGGGRPGQPYRWHGGSCRGWRDGLPGAEVAVCQCRPRTGLMC